MSSQPTVSERGGTVLKHVLEFEKPIAQMEQEILRLEASQAESGRDYSANIKAIRGQLNDTLKKAYRNLSAWESVLVARHPQRPLMRDYVRLLCDDFFELHGDKLYADDQAIVCGFARLGGRRVMLVGHHKGRETKERVRVNFGCAHPDGYRKALQKMQLAAKFKVPIVSLVDTPGAYPGIGAEERGIARAIAVNLMEMSRLSTPIVACVIGEGGSGGALGIAVADRIGVMQHAYYSVISPEGCAAILWKSNTYAPQAAEALRLTPRELKRLGLIDSVVDEPLGGAHRDPEAAAKHLGDWIDSNLEELLRVKKDTLLKRRYERLRQLGSFFDAKPDAQAEAQTVEAPSARRRTRRSKAPVEAGRT